MEWVGRVYRPPSEARSILLQVTVGCSWNNCTYCDMYRDKTFRPKAQDTIESDLRELADLADSGQLHVERPVQWTELTIFPCPFVFPILVCSIELAMAHVPYRELLCSPFRREHDQWFLHRFSNHELEMD